MTPTRSTPELSTRSSVDAVAVVARDWSRSRRASSASTPRLAAASHQSCAEQHRRGSTVRGTRGVAGWLGIVVSTPRGSGGGIAAERERGPAALAPSGAPSWRVRHAHPKKIIMTITMVAALMRKGGAGVQLRAVERRGAAGTRVSFASGVSQDEGPFPLAGKRRSLAERAERACGSATFTA